MCCRLVEGWAGLSGSEQVEQSGILRGLCCLDVTDDCMCRLRVMYV